MSGPDNLYENTERGTPSRAPLVWLGALFLLLGASYLATLGGSGEPASAWALAAGRFHPLLVHLPIGFLIALAGLEVFAWRKRSADVGAARSFLLGASCLFSVLGAAAGFCLAREGGYEAELLFWHQWLGVATAVLALLAAAFLSLSRTGVYRLFLAGGLLTLLWAGHDGASLTHGEDYLTEYLLGESEGTEEVEEYPLEFTKDVLPIFQAKCIPCHGPAKQDGKIRLDVAEQILEGGESGRPAALPGDLSGSYIAELLTLPRNHKLVMPPKERSPLTRRELQIVLQWIYQGAPGLEPEPEE